MQPQRSLALIIVSLVLFAGCFARDLPLADDHSTGATGASNGGIIGYAGVGGGASGSGAAGLCCGVGAAGVWGRGAGGVGGGASGSGAAGKGDWGGAAGAGAAGEGDRSGAAGVGLGNGGSGGAYADAGRSTAGAGGVSGFYGGAGAGLAGAGGETDAGPHCCADGDPCSIDRCQHGACDPHEPRPPGTLGGDADGDNYVAGCGRELDCWDQDARVHPGQTDFFEQPFGTATPADWDYNCDDQLEPEFTASFERCAYISSLDTCVGDGWMLPSATLTPSCGAGGQYAVCRASKGKCTYDVVMLAQRCR